MTCIYLFDGPPQPIIGVPDGAQRPPILTNPWLTLIIDSSRSIMGRLSPSGLAIPRQFTVKLSTYTSRAHGMLLDKAFQKAGGVCFNPTTDRER